MLKNNSGSMPDPSTYSPELLKFIEFTYIESTEEFSTTGFTKLDEIKSKLSAYSLPHMLPKDNSGKTFGDALTEFWNANNAYTKNIKIHHVLDVVKKMDSKFITIKFDSKLITKLVNNYKWTLFDVAKFLENKKNSYSNILVEIEKGNVKLVYDLFIKKMMHKNTVDDKDLYKSAIFMQAFRYVMSKPRRSEKNEIEIRKILKANVELMLQKHKNSFINPIRFILAYFTGDFTISNAGLKVDNNHPFLQNQYVDTIAMLMGIMRSIMEELESKSIHVKSALNTIKNLKIPDMNDGINMLQNLCHWVAYFKAVKSSFTSYKNTVDFDYQLAISSQFTKTEYNQLIASGVDVDIQFAPELLISYVKHFVSNNEYHSETRETGSKDSFVDLPRDLLKSRGKLINVLTSNESVEGKLKALTSLIIIDDENAVDYIWFVFMYLKQDGRISGHNLLFDPSTGSKIVLDYIRRRNIKYLNARDNFGTMNVALENILKSKPTDNPLAKKQCPPGKVLNLVTNRCKKITTVATKQCPPGTVLNPATNRCKKITTVATKQCPPGKVLNPVTNRCKKITTVAKKQ